MAINGKYVIIIAIEIICKGRVIIVNYVWTDISDFTSSPTNCDCPSFSSHPGPELLQLLQRLPNNVYSGHQNQPAIWRVKTK